MINWITWLGQANKDTGTIEDEMLKFCLAWGTANESKSDFFLPIRVLESHSN